ncbi:Glycoside hydrolase 97 [compost metagenome]
MRDLPVTWDKTLGLKGSDIGRCAILAKKNGTDWYVAAINGLDKAQDITLDLSFIKNLSAYTATVIADVNESFSSMATNPAQLNKKKITIPAGGGLVVHLKPIEK